VIHPTTRKVFANPPVPQHHWQSVGDLAKHALSIPDLRRVVEPRGLRQVAQRNASQAPARRVEAPAPAVPSRMEALIARVRARELADIAACKADTLCRRRLRGKQPARAPAPAQQF